MHKNRFLYVLFFITVLAFAPLSQAAEVTYTSQARISNDDVKTAQRVSLNNALLGGIRYYINTHVPGHSGDVTTDYLMFMQSYSILDRKIVDGSVQTTVHIVMDDLIGEDVATHVTSQVNTAVFLVRGLPNYIPDGSVRRNISSIFNSQLFSTKDQIAFEQEIIDIDSHSDVMASFQAISAQYMFDFSFNLKSYRGGESCTLEGESSYVALSDISRVIPVLRTEITMEHSDTTECVLLAISTSVDTALKHVRDRLIDSPAEELEYYHYNLQFTHITELKSVNDVIEMLKRRKFVTDYQMSEFRGDEAIFEVEGYFSPSELAERLRNAQFYGIQNISSDRQRVILLMQ